MATGNIKGGKRNYAKVTPPTTTSAALTDGDVTVTVTNSTLGPQLSSYLVTGTSSDGGTATTTTSSTSPIIIDTVTPNKTYTFQVAGVNYNGTGVFATATNAVTSGSVYALDSTINSTGNYTIPSGKSKLMAVVVGAGSAGGTPDAISGMSGPGGAGGSTGGIATIWNVSVTAGTTAAITIGAPGSSTILSYGGTDIATVTTATVGNNNAGQAGSGGTASTNIATNRVLTNGTAGPAGADRLGALGNGLPGSAGAAVNFSTANLGIGSLQPTALTFTLGTGASGGSGGFQNESSPARNGGAAANGGTNAGNSGAGGNVSSGANAGAAGNAATTFGSGGGGGGGGAFSNYWAGGTSRGGGTGGAGGSGRVYIFVK